MIGQASSGEEGIQVARETKSDLVLLDLSMPRMDGLEALPRIHEVIPETNIVIYSGFQEKEMASAANERGAAGYIEKGGKPDRKRRRTRSTAQNGVQNFVIQRQVTALMLPSPLNTCLKTGICAHFLYQQGAGNDANHHQEARLFRADEDVTFPPTSGCAFQTQRQPLCYQHQAGGRG